MNVSETIRRIRQARPEYGDAMDMAQRLLNDIDEVCAAKKWTYEKYFDVNPAELWHLQEVAELISSAYESRTGHRVETDD